MNAIETITILDAYRKLVDKYGAEQAPIALIRRLQSADSAKTTLGIELRRWDETGEVYDDWSEDLLAAAKKHIVEREMARYDREVCGDDLYESDAEVVEFLHQKFAETIGMMSSLFSIANEPTADFE